MKIRLIHLAFYLLVATCFSTCNTPNANVSKQLFDLNWKFKFNANGFVAGQAIEKGGWNDIDLPCDLGKKEELSNHELIGGSNSNSLSAIWYLKEFEIPQEWSGKKIYIDFEGISHHSEIFVNGESIEHSIKDNGSCLILISPYLVIQKTNVIVISIKIDGESKLNSGIYKDVWLLVSENQVFAKIRPLLTDLRFSFCFIPNTLVE